MDFFAQGHRLRPSIGRNCEFGKHQVAKTASQQPNEDVQHCLISFLEPNAVSGALVLRHRNQNRFRTGGNHPLTVQKWNHDLAKTAIGWS